MAVKEKGAEVKKTKYICRGIAFSPEEYDRLKTEAEKSRRSISAQANYLIDLGFKSLARRG